MSDGTLNRRVLITGAASGLGWELALRYHRSGWFVILVDRDSEKLSRCVEELADRCESICVDLTDSGAVSESLRPLLDARLDLLINNAGMTHRSRASETDPEVFQRIMAINWFVPVWLTQQLLPALARSGGDVICISSMAGIMPVPGRAAYAASKAALAQHFETWRPELRQMGIGLLIVYPSFLHTAIEANALGCDGQPTERPRSTVGSIGSPAEMAERIIAAYQSRRQRLLSPQWSSRFAAWLWTRAPWLHQRLMWRKFAEELDPE